MPYYFDVLVCRLIKYDDLKITSIFAMFGFSSMCLMYKICKQGTKYYYKYFNIMRSTSVENKQKMKKKAEQKRIQCLPARCLPVAKKKKKKNNPTDIRMRFYFFLIYRKNPISCQCTVYHDEFGIFVTRLSKNY